MTRFKNALLDELVTYARQSAPAGRSVRSRRVQRIRIGSLAGAGAAMVAAAVAVSVIGPTGQPAAYAVEKNDDGTVTVTFRELGHAADATRDLRAAGVPAQVVRLAAPGSCATTESGEPLPTGPAQAGAWSIQMPSGYPYDGDIRAWLPAQSSTSLTINPSAIPTGAVLFIIEHSTPEAAAMVTAGLVNAPAPACWEAAELSTGSRGTPGDHSPSPGESVPGSAPSPGRSAEPSPPPSN